MSDSNTSGDEVLTSRLILSDAVGKMATAIDARNDVDLNDAQAHRQADVDVCLSVRTVGTAFVDYFGWLDSAGDVDAEFSDLVASMQLAAGSIADSSHEHADAFRHSIREKIELVQRLMNGEPADDVFAAL